MPDYQITVGGKDYAVTFAAIPSQQDLADAADSLAGHGQPGGTSPASQPMAPASNGKLPAVQGAPDGAASPLVSSPAYPVPSQTPAPSRIDQLRQHQADLINQLHEMTAGEAQGMTVSPQDRARAAQDLYNTHHQIAAMTGVQLPNEYTTTPGGPTGNLTPLPPQAVVHGPATGPTGNLTPPPDQYKVDMSGRTPLPTSPQIAPGVSAPEPSLLDKIKDFISGGAQMEAADVHGAAAPVAEAIHKALPTGLIRPDVANVLKNAPDFGVRSAYYALQNLDPTQVPALVSALSAQGGVQTTAREVKGIFNKAIAGDVDAQAQVVGMAQALVAGVALHTAGGALMEGTHLASGPDIHAPEANPAPAVTASNTMSKWHYTQDVENDIAANLASRDPKVMAKVAQGDFSGVKTYQNAVAAVRSEMQSRGMPPNPDIISGAVEAIKNKLDSALGRSPSAESAPADLHPESPSSPDVTPDNSNGIPSLERYTMGTKASDEPDQSSSPIVQTPAPSENAAPVQTPAPLAVAPSPISGPSALPSVVASAPAVQAPQPTSQAPEVGSTSPLSAQSTTTGPPGQENAPATPTAPISTVGDAPSLAPLTFTRARDMEIASRDSKLSAYYDFSNPVKIDGGMQVNPIQLVAPTGDGGLPEMPGSPEAKEPNAFSLNQSKTNAKNPPTTGTTPVATPSPAPAPSGTTPPSPPAPPASTASAAPSPNSPPQRTAMQNVAQAVKSALGDSEPGPGEQAQLLAREHGAEKARRLEVMIQNLTSAGKAMQSRPVAARWDFVNRMETGQPQLTREDQAAADAIRKMLDDRTKEIDALGDGAMRTWIEHYFPHIWQDPATAGNKILNFIGGKSPLEGSKAFLKHRSIPTIADGMAQGLVPITDDPIELAIAKAHEMDKYILATRMIQDLKARGLAEFTSVFTPSKDLRSAGLVKVDDPAFTVNGPGKVAVNEYFDPAVRTQLEHFADSLGIDHQRVMSIKAKRGALGIEQGGNVMTRHFTPDQVLTHEIGHAIDTKYGLGAWLQKEGGAAYDAESSLLAEYRHEGFNPSQSFKDYTQTPEERVANLVHALVHAPELAGQVAPQSVALLQKFAQQHPEIQPLLDIRPGLTLNKDQVQVPVPGLQTMGHWVVPNDVGKILNNYLSPGLRNSKTGWVKGAYRGYMGVNNVLNQAQLGFSGFHMVGTIVNELKSDVALGLRKASGGVMRLDPKMFAKGALSVMRAPASPLLDVLLGNKIRKAYLGATPQETAMAQIIDGIVKGGGRVSVDSFYKTGSAGAFMKAMRGGQYGAAATKAIPAVFDLASKAIMEGQVPRVKLAAFSRMFQHELELLGPDATDDQIRRAAASVWDSVDNRFGQLVYDNVFWDKAVKDISMGMVRSMGWNVGSLRELGGGMYDLGGDMLNGRFKKTGLSNRSAFFLANRMVHYLVGAMLTYLLTGSGPKDEEDADYPRTGRLNADGTEERMRIPGYRNDEYSFAHDALGTVINKASPVISTVWDLYHNADFYHQKIANEDDPYIQQLKDQAEFLVKQFVPFTASSETQSKTETGGYNLQSAFGVTAGPAWSSQTPAMQKAKAYLAETASVEGKTGAQMAVSALEKQALALYRNGHQDAAMDLVNPEKYPARQQPEVLKAQESFLKSKAAIDAGESPLAIEAKGLSFDQLFHVFDAAKPEERQQLEPVIFQKMSGKGFENLSDTAKQDVMSEIEKRPLLRAAAG